MVNFMDARFVTLDARFATIDAQHANSVAQVGTFSSLDYSLQGYILNKLKGPEQTFINNQTLEFGRVNVDIYARVASVCKTWQKWVFHPFEGPFKLVGAVIKFPISSDLTLIKKAICILNQKIKSDFLVWYNYLDEINKSEDISQFPIPRSVNPNVFKPQVFHKKETIISKTISLLLKKPKLNYLLASLVAAGASKDDIAKGVAIALINKVPIQNEEEKKRNLYRDMPFSIALVFKEIDKEKIIRNFEGVVAKVEKFKLLPITLLKVSEWLQPKVRIILGEFGDQLKVPEWIVNQGCQFSEEDVTAWLITAEKIDSNNRAVFLQIFKYIVSNSPFKNFELDRSGKTAIALINIIVQGTSSKFSEMYLEWILESIPNVLMCDQKIGFSLLSILVKNDSLYQMPQYLTAEHLWKQQLLIHREIMQVLIASKLIGYFGEYSSAVRTFMGNLETIFKKQFQGKKEEFENWLKYPKSIEALNILEPNLLFEIAELNPNLITELISKNILDKAILDDRSKDGILLKDVVERQKELFSIFFSGQINLQKLKENKDHYVSFIEKVQRLGAPSYIFTMIKKFRNMVNLNDPLSVKNVIDPLDFILKIEGPHKLDHEGNTVLHALFYQNTVGYNCLTFDFVAEITITMIDRGVDPLIRNDLGLTAIDIIRNTCLRELSVLIK